MKKLSLIFILILNACGGGVQVDPHSELNLSLNQVETYNLPGDFPPDLLIPAFDPSTVFTLDFTSAAVLPIKLDSSPLDLQKLWPIWDGAALGLGLSPNDLFMLSPSQAFLLGVEDLVYYNPTNGEVWQSVKINEPILLEQALAYSRAEDCDGDGLVESSIGPGTFSPNTPNQVVATPTQVFVSVSNLCFSPDFNSVYTQAMLLVFDLQTEAPYLSPSDPAFIVLEGFNATGLTLTETSLIATATGDTIFQDGQNLPETSSYLNEVSLSTQQVTRSLDLGMIVANFKGVALNEDQSLAWLGSANFSQIYEIDLASFSLSQSFSLSEVANDFISDQVFDKNRNLLFASSFNQSGIFVLNPQEPKQVDFLDLNNLDQPGLTGVGSLALRPGLAGVDFEGPDLWALTGNPGRLLGLQTY
ncbi:MAG: hypothetical protein KDK66_05130 [Deltaproteobacteria bacterium]|nr:hypothetical protein [Deltaproteobacteria bacterium]